MVPTAENFDVVVIGGGPAGYAAALYGASAGLSIALVEKGTIGGTCLNVGCIPAKELLETAAVRRAIVSAAEFGLRTSEPELDFSVTQIRKQSVIDGLIAGLSGLLAKRKVTVFDGLGTLGAEHVVSVSGGTSGEVELHGDAVILASGSVPRVIGGVDVDGTTVVTSDELLSLQSLPASAVVIGGGAIGCEFASMMSDLGTKVTILEALPQILPGCDEDITRIVLRSFKQRDIDVRTGVKVTGHQPQFTGGTTVSFGESESVTVDMVVVSVGRRPLSETLGLGGTSVQVADSGHVVVDERCRTGEPGVWAVGDLIATPALAHVAFAEGMLAICDLLGEEPTPIDHSRVPWCIYCHPEVSFVGHSEASAKAAGFDVVVSTHRYAGTGRALILGEPEGMVKIIAERHEDDTGGRILGVHMVGPWVTEQLGQAYLAVNWDAHIDDVAALIQPHPTLSELFGESVLALTGRSLHG
ncbi:MAG: dihydrolipoyl dehydrogenase [Acidimicrobiia bacterium]